MRGTTIVSLNGQRLLIRNVLHVLAQRFPLYSLWAHLRQSGCRFVGSFDTGMHVYFLGVVLSVDISTDCHLSYEPLGKTAPLSSLHYVQPRCPPVLYPAESSALRARADAAPLPEICLSGDPVLIEDKGSIAHNTGDINNDLPPPFDASESDLPLFVSPVPKQVCWAKLCAFSVHDLTLISKQLQVLSDRLSGLTVSPPPSDLDAPKLLSSLSHEEVVPLAHRPGSALPPVRPCDWSNGSDTKTHWTSEELHHALGCRRFRNYKHIIQTSSMANGLMEGSSCSCWVRLLQFQKLLGVEPLTAKSHSSSTLSTSIVPSVTASWWAAFATPLFLLTAPLVTTGFLV
jgi:hypothetical protein